MDLQGIQVVYTNLTEEVDHFTTNYAVLTHDESKTIVTVFRGSQNAKDWLTNFRAIPAKLFVCCIKLLMLSAY